MEMAPFDSYLRRLVQFPLYQWHAASTYWYLVVYSPLRRDLCRCLSEEVIRRDTSGSSKFTSDLRADNLAIAHADRSSL